MKESDKYPEWMLALVGIAIGSILTTAGTALLSYEQQKTEKTNVAQALYFDISLTSSHLNSSYKDVNSKFTNMNKLNKNTSIILYDPSPYYNDNGAYFIFMKEISMFDGDLSADINQYYQTVLDIEYKRKYIINRLPDGNKIENIPENDIEYLKEYSKTMTIEMRDSVVLADKIKKELKENYDLKLNLSTYPAPIISE
jgi:hypothetical protein